MTPEERAFIERRLSEMPSPSLPAGVEQLFAAYLRLLARVRELEKLAYLGDHHFPDLTYKARLEELVPQHRALEEKVTALTADLDLRDGKVWLLEKVCKELEVDLATRTAERDEALAFMRAMKQDA